MSTDREVVAAAGAAPADGPVTSLMPSSGPDPAQGPLSSLVSSSGPPLPPAVPASGAAARPTPTPVPVTALSIPTAAPTAHAESTDALCANCGATANGHYCANCGQKNEHPIHSLWHFINEATEDLTHADSRLWETLGALLFKPGYLTTEFLAGRRVKYLPPIRLYLVMSVLFFLFAALSPHQEPTPAQRAQITRQLHGHEYIVLGEPIRQPLEERRQHARVTCAKLDARLNAELHAGPLQTAFKSFTHKGCLSAVEDNGHALSEAFLHTLPRALFITLPIMAALMKLTYRRPLRHYVEHLLFLLHNYSFGFLWSAVFILLGWMIPSDTIMDPLSWVFFLYGLYYFFRSMRRVYPEGIGRTLAKFTLLSCGYLVIVGSAVVATVVYSVLAQGPA